MRVVARTVRPSIAAATSSHRELLGTAPTMRSALLAMAVALGTLAVPTAARADDVATWLEQRGLLDLLASHLEEQLEGSKDQQRRQQLATRLAAIYSARLEAAGDAAEATDLESRGRKLLESVQGLEADALRTALLGATQRGAARTLERWRLRLASPAEAETARASLERLLPELRELGKSLGIGLQTLQRKLSRASGVETAMLTEEVERWGRLKAQATFLSAWTLAYLGWMERRIDVLREAEAAFIELLDTGSVAPQPEDVSADLRGLEPYARAILGLALVRGLSQRPSAATPWLDLLATPTAFEPIRNELPAWRLSVLLDAEAWNDAEALLNQLMSDPATPALWIRLAAARALEAESTSNDARRLARVAVAALATRGEIAQVLDLARRYGTEGLTESGGAGGDGGFVINYVRGVERFDAARKRHGGDQPLVPVGEAAATIALYDDAAKALRSATDASDAASYADASAAALALLGWCRWYSGRALDAAEAFERAAEKQRPAEAAESLWMAVVALDRLRGEPSASGSISDRADRLAERLVSEHPSSPRVPYLLLRQSGGSQPATPERVEKLLAVPPGSEVYPAARRAAVQALYELYRNARGPARAEAAQRMLATAVPLFEEEQSNLATLRDAERLGVLVRARQILDAALSPGVQRHELATRVLAQLDAAGAAKQLDLAPVAQELGFRRLEAQLHSGDLVAAERTAAELLQSGTDGVWRETIAKAMFRDAVDRWRASGPGGLDDAAALRAVVDWGGKVLASAESEQDAPLRRAAYSEPAMLSALSTVVEAAARLVIASADADLAERTLARLDELLALRPTDGAALRWDAMTSQAVGQNDRALARLRTLLAGAGVGSELWYESKWRLLSILRTVDPRRAREVMDQHKVLQPDYGPPPWGDRLRDLDGRIPAAVGAASPPDTSATSGEAPR